MSWRSVGHSVQGARHLQHNQTCQDACAIKMTEDIVVMALADGHGDKKHAHSDVGAKVAVDIACELLAEALVNHRNQVGVSDRRLEQFLDGSLAKRIIWEWNQRLNVQLHFSADGAWNEGLISYGTTLLAAAIAPEFAIFFQLGDGDILLLSEGEAAVIFEQSEELYGTVTHSLCQPSSYHHARVHCCSFTLPPELVIMSTDGIRDSLQGDREQYIRIAHWLSQQVEKKGWATFTDQLPSWLSSLSEKGNGDDVSLAFAQWQPSSQNPTQELQ